MRDARPPLVIDRGGFIGGLSAALLAPPAAAQVRFSFLVVGDWGRNPPVQRQVAGAMANAAVEVGSRFVVSVGDNFYPDGVTTVADRHWRATFEDVYAAASLQTPWYVALGNHDHRGVPQAQVDYSSRSHRWRMPSPFFKVSGGPLTPGLDLFVLDTTPLVRARASSSRRAQLRWLERELAASRARWKVVVGHHPVFSGGQHGGERFLQARLPPLLQRHGVTLYLNGHDHDLQHIERGGAHYVIVGAGAGAERPVTRVAGSRFWAATPGFAIVTVEPGGLTLRFRDANNATLYQARLGA